MFTLAVALQKNEKWPKDLPVVELQQANQDDLLQSFKDQLAAHLDDVQDFVRSTRNLTKNLPEQTCGNNEFCKAFVSMTSLDDQDYFLYKGYIESVLDSVIAIKPQIDDGTYKSLFGYSLAVRNNAPKDKDTYNYLQKVAYALKTNDYTGLAIAGLDAFFAVYDKSEKTFVAITRDMGDNATYPDFDDDQQSVDVNAFAQETASQKLFSFFYNGSQDNLAYYMNNYTQQSGSELIAIYSYQSNANGELQRYKSTTDDYTRYVNGTKMNSNDSYDTNSYVQTFQRAHSDRVVQSDYRIVQMENSLDSLKDIDSLKNWWSALNVYPMRSQTTSVMMAFTAEDDDDKLYLTKCNSVYDAQGNTAGCENPPVPCSVASVVCSILIIIAVIAIWVYGCIQAKKFDQLQEQISK